MKRVMSDLRKARILKELSIDEVYLKTGIDRAKISRIERGINKPSEREKKLIAKALRIPVKEIFPN